MAGEKAQTYSPPNRLKIYERKSAARRLHMSVAKLDEIRYQGRIKFCKEGVRIYFLESHLLEYALSIQEPCVGPSMVQ